MQWSVFYGVPKCDGILKSAMRYSATVVFEGCVFGIVILFIYYKYPTKGNEQGVIFNCSTVACSAIQGKIPDPTNLRARWLGKNDK